MKSCCLLSLAFRHSVVDNKGDRDKLEPKQMKTLPTLSYEELLTNARRGDREDMILRRPVLRKGGKISFCVFTKGEKTQERIFRLIARILPFMTLLESSSGASSHPRWSSKCRTVGISWGGSLVWNQIDSNPDSSTSNLCDLGLIS